MAGLQVRPITSEFGVEITGVEPVAPLPAEIRKQLKTLLDECGLLVFRGLDADTRFQTYLSEMLAGNDSVNPDDLRLFDDFRVSNVDKDNASPFGRLLYHHELMWVEDGCKVASLYGKHVEQPSVPTLFVSAEHAWKTLPGSLRARVGGRFAIHCQDATRQRRHNTNDVLQIAFDVEKFVRLPIGYRHPRNGQTVLYVCPLATHHIEGMDYEEGETLLEELFDHLYAAENVYAHEWRQGDLVIWDNVTLQHARPNVSFKGSPRVLRKTMTPHPTSEQSGLTEDKAPKFSTAET